MDVLATTIFKTRCFCCRCCCCVVSGAPEDGNKGSAHHWISQDRREKTASTKITALAKGRIYFDLGVKIFPLSAVSRQCKSERTVRRSSNRPYTGRCYDVPCACSRSLLSKFYEIITPWKCTCATVQRTPLSHSRLRCKKQIPWALPPSRRSPPLTISSRLPSRLPSVSSPPRCARKLDNGLVEINAVEFLAALVFLDCSGNQISNLPGFVGSLRGPRHLKEVVADGNPVRCSARIRLSLALPTLHVFPPTYSHKPQHEHVFFITSAAPRVVS